MAIAGVLEVQMLANMARLSDDMRQARQTVGTAMGAIEKSVASAKSALGALGIGISLVGFTRLIKGSIDAMDKLNDLSKATSITVERLAGLRLAAQQSGGDLSSIADSINKLSQNMGKDADKFRQLGITAKEPLEAFKQLADIYVKLEDPQQRAAVMAQALGKSWAGAAPLLAEGSAKIQEMVDKGILLSGVTKQMAEEADKFNDEMVELNTTLDALTTRAIVPLLPGLNAMAQSLNKSAQEGNFLLGILKEIIKLDVALMKTLGLPVDRLAEALFSEGGAGAVLKPGAAAPEPDKATADAAAAFLAGDDKGKGDSAMARALQEGMDEEAKIMAETAQLTDDFRRQERERDQATVDLRTKILIEAYEREQAEAIANGEQLLEIERAITQGRKDEEAQRMAQAHTFFGSLTKLMDTQSKRMFKIGKLAAAAETAINTYAAAMGAYKALSSIPYIGPALGAAAAAAITLAGAANIAKINATEIGGATGAIGTFPASPQTGQPVAAANAQPTNTQTTIINMPPGQFFDRATIRKLFEGLNEDSVDGSRFVVTEGGAR